MKRIIIFLILLGSAWGQGVMGIPDSGEFRWRVAVWGSLPYSYVHPTIPGVYDYVLQGDTLINGIKYRKLFREQVQRGTVPPIFTTDPSLYEQNRPGLIGFLRYDSLSQKLFFRRHPDGFQAVLWDFDSLNFGKLRLPRLKGPVAKNVNHSPVDNHSPGGYCNNEHVPHTCVIDSVDTVNVLGVPRRRFHITTLGADSLYSCLRYKDGWFIEGIGHESGIFSNTYVGPWDSTWRVGYEARFNFVPCFDSTGYEEFLTPYGKLLCVTYDSLQHAFVPGGCDITPTVQRQNYVPFPDDTGAVWSVEAFVNYDWISHYYYYSVRTGKKVFKDGKWKVPLYINSSLTGYYWQDTVNRKIWMSYDQVDSILLYDFGLQIGHIPDIPTSLYIYYTPIFRIFTSQYPYVSTYTYLNIAQFGWLGKVDSVQIGNEIRRRYHYYITYPNGASPDSLKYRHLHETIKIIEGIGSLADPFGSQNLIPGDNPFYISSVPGAPNQCSNYYTSVYILQTSYGESYRLLCFKYKDFEYILDTLRCNLTVGTVFSEDLSPRIKILMDKITIDMLGEGIMERVSVYNVLGQEESLPTSIHGNRYELDISGLAQGVHILQVQTQHGIFTRKFYKN